ncbi:MAG: FAD-dependent oxidoreductase [Anaerolineales bacterium]|nr:FAD-dependent oxidoreductase [Anaerolineales bacterium]
MDEARYPVTIPDLDFWRKMVKCQAACPVLTDARGYVTAIGRGELELGYEIAHDPNPLSTVCGRICGAPCEVACRRQEVGPDYQSVAIRPLKRVVTERYGPETRLRLPGAGRGNGSAAERPRGKPGVDFSTVRWSRRNLQVLAAQPGRKRGRVAIIGAGPSGLAAANDLALLGHSVIIYEAGPKPGGMMRYGVPVYRIDWEAMDKEIESILEQGVAIHYNTPIGEALGLTDLRRDYDAVYLGIGLMQGKRLNIEGVDLDGVVPAVDLLLNYNLGYRLELGKRVIVVGGGDVAMDAARTALRLGVATAEQQAALENTAARLDDEADSMRTALDVARTALRLGVADVRVIALESWEELPASEFEVVEAQEEGIHIFPRRGPVRILGEAGRVRGLEVIDVASVFDEAGRFNPRFVPGTNQVWECESVILAIGQAADLTPLKGAEDIRISGRGLVEVDPETGQTSAVDVFAGGDVAYGPRLIIHAVRDGQVAALGIDAAIQGRKLKTQVVSRWKELPHHQMPEDWIKYQRTRVPALPVERRTGISTVEVGYPVEEARIQGLRCLECSLNTIFDGSKCILCNGCVDVCPWDCLKIVRVDDLQGEASLPELVEAALGAPVECYREETTPSVAAMIKDDLACTRCALCVRRCPTGAITMESFRFDEILTYAAPQP